MVNVPAGGISRIRNLQILQSLPQSEIKSGGYVIESYYGYDAIPKAWKMDIIRREWIEEMCEDCIR